MYINRHILPYLERMKKQFRVLLITGSRQVGKATLLKNKLLPEYDYVTLDDFSDLSIAQEDASLFFKNHPLPVIVDEVQRAPNLFLQIKLLADNSEEKGKIILTGSQSYKLLSNASDSLAGRVCIINMSSLSLREKYGIDFNTEFLPTEEYISKRKNFIKTYENLWNHIWRGSMPELADDTVEWESFYRSYIRTYIDRDVADLIDVKNLVKFNNFMQCIASRVGELFNADSLARDVGVTSKTISQWTSILESSGVIKLLQPYEKNVSNRAVKTPKIYFMDTGLVCHLVGWSSSQVAMNGAMSGSLFENFVISEIIKSYYNSGHDSKDIYFYRDKDKKEIDLIIEKDNILYPIEIKKSAQPTIDMAKSLSVLHKIPGKTVGQGCILCQCDKMHYLSDNVAALPVEYI
ncbi:MAG: ATP-binding protein [Spirochaetia bacterium]|nr:ATP-binding protein [Spirochaetia bacterium]